MENSKILTDALDELKIEYDDKKIELLLKYYDMLIEKNKVMNLTAITDFNEVMIKHFADSLSVLQFVEFENDNKVLDLGTGAGFPGIPLKIFLPNVEFLLVDSVNKKLNFINEVIEKLGLNKISVLHARAEELGHKEDFREKFDFVCSRAVANLSTLSEYTIPFLRQDGLFISYKASIVNEEITNAEKAIKILGAKIEKVEKFSLPGIGDERDFVFIKKISKTPKKYPRKSGVPSKEPL
ncbi:MAG: 16S rRNA (guanine(527)-N(7))-methyltransferase RsmG [Lachnospiraceae bacterium]|nr:16S rRNA (guanine(527)-N(7))-methyltransferase RsmG [Lachnospiraceae bacterium]